ncbi:hybrid sensor histidine kinase/response regulator [Rhizobium sp. KAs_5_22]|uniref:PAS domain S-box protein n=1 Tax=Ciceribacter selenitireducens TaxID=448181 RepID=UPI0004B9CCBF|nr:PAS domain S-box protein [Ciceribacter selenitireducens]PPJ47875.1 hybrid sensor histidine kinase/response regulator [Rhizobium sp. KAs_5_22]
MTDAPLEFFERRHVRSGTSFNYLSAGEIPFLEALLVGIFDCAAVIDLSRRYLYVNQEYVDFVGKPASEIIGKTILDVLGDALDNSYRMAIATLPTGGSIGREGWIDYGALGRRYIKQTITCYPQGSGPVAGHIILSRDLTDLKVQQLELEWRIEAQTQADTYHAVIVNNALDAIVVIDETGAVVDFNPAAVSIFGYSRDEAMGRQIGDLIIPETLRAAHDRGLSNYLQSGMTRILGRRLELEAQRATGEQIPIELTITEVRLGTKRLFAAHLRDLAAVRRAQEEIERQREALHQKDKLAALGSLLAAVAHELNNPLSIVIGQTMMLRETLAGIPMAADLVQRSAKIEIAAHRCARIVRSFLDMARQRKHERKSVLIPDIVKAALGLLSYNLKSSGVEVDIDLPKDLPVLWIDADQIHQVIVNLVVNAYQSLEEKTEGLRRIRISADHDPRAKAISLRISDNGTGIPPSIRSRIFDPYFTTKPQGTGTGIGLAVSRGLIESHGGTLDLDPSPSLGGAGFVIVLPIDDTGADPCTEDKPEAAFQAETTGRHVLIIDDEIEIANLLADMVRKLGFSASVATGGDAAKALFEGAIQPVHAILCDIRMPGGDGPSFFDWLRQNHPHLTECVGFITGDTLGPAAGRFLARSGCPVIEKPFMPDDIQRILKTLVKMDAPT